MKVTTSEFSWFQILQQNKARLSPRLGKIESGKLRLEKIEIGNPCSSQEQAMFIYLLWTMLYLFKMWAWEIYKLACSWVTINLSYSFIQFTNKSHRRTLIERFFFPARKRHICSRRIIKTLIEHRFCLLKILHRWNRRLTPNRTKDFFSLLSRDASIIFMLQ